MTGTPEYVRHYQKLTTSSAIPAEAEYDLVFVLPPKNHQGWILDGICREIAQHVDARTAFVEFGAKVPTALGYFYSHYGYLRDTLRQQPDVLHCRNLLFYTHPRQLWYSGKELVHVMNMADSVINMCSMFVPSLIAQGVHSDRLEVALVGADPELFLPHVRGTGKVGFCSGYLPRKGGDRMLELVRAMPSQNFVLCGKRWPNWEHFDKLISLPNFDYVDMPYREYPKFYDSIDVFVSVSELEGGPVPLIEAAMCNAVPVCSNTGHAPDIIVHGENGYLFDTAAPIQEIITLIKEALNSTCDVRSTVDHLTWKRFSYQIQEIAGLRHAETVTLISNAA